MTVELPADDTVRERSLAAGREYADLPMADRGSEPDPGRDLSVPDNRRGLARLVGSPAVTRIAAITDYAFAAVVFALAVQLVAFVSLFGTTFVMRQLPASTPRIFLGVVLLALVVSTSVLGRLLLGPLLRASTQRRPTLRERN